MNQELFFVLFSWAIALSPYSRPDTVPALEFHNHAWFVEHACPTMNDCRVLAWYNDEGIIHIDESLDLEGGLATSLVVHESVHFLQDPDMEPCEREREAYAVQNAYIIEVLTTLHRAKPVCIPKNL